MQKIYYSYMVVYDGQERKLKIRLNAHVVALSIGESHRRRLRMVIREPVGQPKGN